MSEAQATTSESDQIGAMLGQIGDGTLASEIAAPDGAAAVDGSDSFDFPSGEAGAELIKLFGGDEAQVPEPAVEESAPTQAVEEQPAPNAPRDPDTGQFMSHDEYKSRVAALEKREAEIEAYNQRQRANENLLPKFNPTDYETYIRKAEESARHELARLQQLQQSPYSQEQQQDVYGYEEPVPMDSQPLSKEHLELKARVEHLTDYIAKRDQHARQVEANEAAEALNFRTVKAIHDLGVSDPKHAESLRQMVLAQYHATDGRFAVPYLAKQVYSTINSMASRPQESVPHAGENQRVSGRQPGGASAKPDADKHPVLQSFGNSDDWESGIAALRKHFDV